jgi:alpha-1,6-mannosyltransferase
MEAVHGESAEDEVVQRQNERFGRTHGALLILLAAAVALAPYATARFGFRGFVALYAVAALSWLPLRNASLRLPYVIAIAIVLRALLLFAEPRLSGDVYRYLSDGRVLASGHNPYAYMPTDPRINHPEIRSIYPPHAQLLFAAVHQLTAWRLLIIAFDLVAIVLLRRHALAYATFPALLFEGTWSGHIDAIAGVLLAIALLRGSGVAAAFAGGMKVIPLAALPALLRRAQNRTRFVFTFAAALLLPIIPFLGRPIMPGLRDYATRWIFNSPLYDALFAIVDRIPTKTIWTHHPLRFQLISDFVYRHLYTDFLTRAVMAAIALGLIACAKRASTAVAALLLCSPAIHPWYWLVLVPASLVESRRWTLVALCAPFSYLLYTGTPAIAVYLLCYGVLAISIER